MFVLLPWAELHWIATLNSWVGLDLDRTVITLFQRKTKKGAFQCTDTSKVSSISYYFLTINVFTYECSEQTANAYRSLKVVSLTGKKAVYFSSQENNATLFVVSIYRMLPLQWMSRGNPAFCDRFMNVKFIASSYLSKFFPSDFLNHSNKKNVWNHICM